MGFLSWDLTSQHLHLSPFSSLQSWTEAVRCCAYLRCGLARDALLLYPSPNPHPDPPRPRPRSRSCSRPSATMPLSLPPGDDEAFRMGPISFGGSREAVGLWGRAVACAVAADG